ncbi:hypothetical protein OSB04_001855 [Centaurea solstitialis]|uniref:F-box domain-containing protein n=1 Tax=Centaurea solstitialis TaxID=347529 RepID=A0AA38TS53_9ASTR|nr:hypothetical protein OSB04_001855 [Centaurea solstitialis]
MEEKRDWLQMPDEIMGGMIFQRLDHVDILTRVQKVCRNWRRICKDPAMWKVIDFKYCFNGRNKDFYRKLTKQAVHLSSGELIDINLNGFGTDNLLDHISRCSSKLNRLCLTQCHGVTGCGLSNSLKRLPHLETLEISFVDIRKEDIEVIGRTCPLLKSFEMEAMWDGDVYAHAIAKSMPALRHLRLIGIMDDDDGVQAILNGCPNLESLDLRLCAYFDRDRNLEKLCRERIKDFVQKDFKYDRYNIPKANEDSDTDDFSDDDARSEANEDSVRDDFDDDDDDGDAPDWSSNSLIIIFQRMAGETNPINPMQGCTLNQPHMGETETDGVVDNQPINEEENLPANNMANDQNEGREGNTQTGDGVDKVEIKRKRQKTLVVWEEFVEVTLPNGKQKLSAFIARHDWLKLEPELQRHINDIWKVVQSANNTNEPNNCLIFNQKLLMEIISCIRLLHQIQRYKELSMGMVHLLRLLWSSYVHSNLLMFSKFQVDGNHFKPGKYLPDKSNFPHLLGYEFWSLAPHLVSYQHGPRNKLINKLNDIGKSLPDETRNWLEMPDEIMGGMILQRLNAVEILTSAQKVCRNWRRICKDPAMWKVIDMDDGYDPSDDIEKLCKQAVYRSCGELIDISLRFFGNYDLLVHISRCSIKLNRLCLRGCYGITGCELSKAVKLLPHLETLELYDIDCYAEDIEVIGHNCPQLKFFTIKRDFTERGDDVHADVIANSMPALHHLKLAGTTDSDGVQAILNGCPHLESLDLHGCIYLDLDENLEKLCRERIKDFRYFRYNIRNGDEDSYMCLTAQDIDDFYDGRGMDLLDDDIDDYGFYYSCAISAVDDYDSDQPYSP